MQAVMFILYALSRFFKYRVVLLSFVLLSIVKFHGSWQSVRGYILKTISYWHEGRHLAHVCSKHSFMI